MARPAQRSWDHMLGARRVQDMTTKSTRNNKDAGSNYISIGNMSSHPLLSVKNGHCSNLRVLSSRIKIT